MPFQLFKHTTTGEFFVRLSEPNGKQLLSSSALDNENAAKRCQRTVINTFFKDPKLIDLILNGLSEKIELSDEDKTTAIFAIERALDKAAEVQMKNVGVLSRHGWNPKAGWCSSNK